MQRETMDLLKSLNQHAERMAIPRYRRGSIPTMAFKMQAKRA
jgi:hypothetical protein